MPPKTRTFKTQIGAPEKLFGNHFIFQNTILYLQPNLRITREWPIINPPSKELEAMLLKD